jgi:uracil-DNA glycosylase
MPGNDCPKSLSNPAEVDARKALLHHPHISPLTAFVEKLRSEAGKTKEVPYFDPWDGGIEAECLFLLEAPGRRAVDSGFISRNNPDETAKNWFELNLAAGIHRERTISWNLVPWYIGSDVRIRPARSNDIQEGWPYLQRLIVLLPRLRVVALLGRNAQSVSDQLLERYPALRIFKLPHPSPLFVNHAPGNRERLKSQLIEVRKALDFSLPTEAGP